MNAQQVLISHVQFTLPNATTRATAAKFAKWLAKPQLAACKTPGAEKNDHLNRRRRRRRLC